MMDRWVHYAQTDECPHCGWETGKYESPSRFCPGCGAKLMGETLCHYAVIMDGWTGGCGSSLYLVGVYADEEDAKRVANETSKKHDRVYVRIVDFEMEKTYPVKKNDYFHRKFYNNKKYLGGFTIE